MMPHHTQSDIESFDREHERALRSLWFLGDVHAEFRHIPRALLAAKELPSHLIFLGDVDIDHKPFKEILEPLRKHFSSVKVAFIHGNHDADSYEHWTCLHDCGDALVLHGKVTELNGVRLAGLGGNFLGRVWYPPEPPKFDSQEAAINRGAFQFRGGQHPSSTYLGAIYPDVYDRLAKLRADILVTHEAPGCHQHGFEALDVLAMDLRVKRCFHGHHHDDRTDEYRLGVAERGYDAIGVDGCAITNGLGERVLRRNPEW
ncbi:MAG: metallophosphoesterase [Rhodoferax sp.]|nr:metallophosphoesterase [Rhodoferax sp.]